MKNIELRPYQKQCIEAIEAEPPGAYLVQMATGLGKTVTFANIPRHGGRMLILSHREELTEQPRKYFDCSFGIERADLHSSGEEVVSASVQSLARRLDKFKPDDFPWIICDECHHISANTYRKIISYFNPAKLIGFTATPNRADGVRLDDIFSKIIFKRDIRWAIENGYLCDIFARRVNIGCDLSKVRVSMGDFAPGELEKAMDGTEDAIAEAYRKYAKGPTIIFAASVNHAEKIAAKIPGAAVVTGKTEDRSSIVKAFSDGIIPVIVNVMVFTEGTDIPCIETVIMARPTKSETLYTQAVGRALRPYPGKERATLIDCVGITGRASLCTAPTLLGVDMESVLAEKRDEVQGELFTLPEKAVIASDTPLSWIKSTRIVDLWARQNAYDTRDLNFTKLPTNELVISLSGGERITIPAPDALGQITCKDGRKIPMQQAIDRVYAYLINRRPDQRYLWDLREVKKWGQAPATESQLKYVRRVLKEQTPDNLTKGEAGQFLNRLFAQKKQRGTTRKRVRA